MYSLPYTVEFSGRVDVLPPLYSRVQWLGSFTLTMTLHCIDQAELYTGNYKHWTVDNTSGYSSYPSWISKIVTGQLVWMCILDPLYGLSQSWYLFFGFRFGLFVWKFWQICRGWQVSFLWRIFRSRMVQHFPPRFGIALVLFKQRNRLRTQRFSSGEIVEPGYEYPSWLEPLPSQLLSARERTVIHTKGTLQSAYKPAYCR